MALLLLPGCSGGVDGLLPVGASGRPASGAAASGSTASSPAASSPAASSPDASSPAGSGAAGSSPAARPPSAGASTEVAAGPVARALAALPVRPRGERTGYDRELFGPAWADTDRNGCGTRDDVLRRDLQEVVVREGTRGCVVVAGVLEDPYSGARVVFTKADAGRVHVDHVVSLSDAWQTGARTWSAQRRLAFANDPLNLVATTAQSNLAKRDSDAASWLPPDRGAWCPMVARQVAVKARWGLWVKPAERDAVLRVLQRCPDQALPEDGTSAPHALPPDAS